MKLFTISHSYIALNEFTHLVDKCVTKILCVFIDSEKLLQFAQCTNWFFFLLVLAILHLKNFKAISVISFSCLC